MSDQVTVDSALAAMSEAGAPAFSQENSAPKIANVADTTQLQNDGDNGDPGFDENGDPVDPAQPDNQRKKQNWDRTTVNAFNRKTKTINYLKSQNENLLTQTRTAEARIAALELVTRGGQPAAPADQKPAQSAQAALGQVDPNDPYPQDNDVDANGKHKYANFGELWDARTRWNTRQAFAEAQKKLNDTQAAQAAAAKAQQEEARISSEAKVFVESVPDAMDLLRANQAVINALSPQVEALLLQAENTPLTVYNLAKEGKLAQLNQMPIARAAFEIGRAMSIALPNSQAAAPAQPQNQISSAPNPPSRPANGTGTGNSTGLDAQLSGRELLKRMQAS